MSNDKIHVIPTAADKLVGDVEAMKRSLPALIEVMQARAQMQRAHYVALLEAGFKPEQALFIVSQDKFGGK